MTDKTSTSIRLGYETKRWLDRSPSTPRSQQLENDILVLRGLIELASSKNSENMTIKRALEFVCKMSGNLPVLESLKGDRPWR